MVRYRNNIQFSLFCQAFSWNAALSQDESGYGRLLSVRKGAIDRFTRAHTAKTYSAQLQAVLHVWQYNVSIYENSCNNISYGCVNDT